MKHLYSVIRHLRDMNVPASFDPYFTVDGHNTQPHTSAIRVGKEVYSLDVPRRDTSHRPVDILRWKPSRGWVRIADTHRDGHWRVRIARAITANLKTQSARGQKTEPATTTTSFGEPLQPPKA